MINKKPLQKPNVENINNFENFAGHITIFQITYCLSLRFEFKPQWTVKTMEPKQNHDLCFISSQFYCFGPVFSITEIIEQFEYVKIIEGVALI